MWEYVWDFSGLYLFTGYFFHLHPATSSSLFSNQCFKNKRVSNGIFVILSCTKNPLWGLLQLQRKHKHWLHGNHLLLF